MSNSNAEQPAFPEPFSTYNPKDGGIEHRSVSGLTKREYFAAMAMQGLLACPDVNGSQSELAIDSIDFADALLSALEEKKV